MRSTVLIVGLGLIGCQAISGLDEIEIVDAPTGGAGAGIPAGAGGVGQAGGAGGAGPLVCEEGTLDRNRIDDDGCEFVPNIPTDALVLWLSPEFGIPPGQTHVSEWLDQSSRRNDFSQPLPESMPLLVAGELNHPALGFGREDEDDDGIPDGDNLRSTNFLVADFGLGFTFAAVVRRDVVGNQDTLLDMVIKGGRNDNKNIYMSQAGTGDHIWFGTTVDHPNRVISSGGLYTPNTPHIITIAVGPSYLRFRYDGQDSSIEDRPIPILPATTELSAVLGANIASTMTKFHHGLIAEIVMYERALDDDELTRVEQHLQDEWGL